MAINNMYITLGNTGKITSSKNLTVVQHSSSSILNLYYDDAVYTDITFTWRQPDGTIIGPRHGIISHDNTSPKVCTYAVTSDITDMIISGSSARLGLSISCYSTDAYGHSIIGAVAETNVTVTYSNNEASVTDEYNTDMTNL